MATVLKEDDDGPGERWGEASAQRLAAALRRAGISQADAVRRSGHRDSSRLNKWLSGANRPRADDLAHLLRCCGLSADEVLGLEMGLQRQLNALRARISEARAVLERAEALDVDALAELGETVARAGTPGRQR